MTRWLAKLVVLGAGALLLLPAGWPRAGAGDNPPASKANYSQPFRGKPDDHERYVLRGPDAAKHVTFEPEGLRITLPPGYPQQRPSIGLGLASSVQGNFEITARFELIKEPDAHDAGSQATRVTLGVLLDSPERKEAAVSRRVVRGKTEFYTFLLMESAGEGRPHLHAVPTEAKAGRLRLVRTGSQLALFAAEGDQENFVLLQEQPFSALDVKQVFVHTSTGGPKAELDVRVSDLRIVADSLPDLAARAAPETRSKRWLTAAVILNVLLLVCAVFVGVRALRRRARAQACRGKERPA